MRKFYLIADGTRIDLNNGDSYNAMLTDPTGLGVNFTGSYSDITGRGGDYFSSSYKAQQNKIVGSLVFLSSAYTKYKNFVDAVITANSLVFVYNPNGTEYKADCDLAYITKTESVGCVYMTCPISFNLLSPWYKEETLTGTGSVSVAAGGQLETAVKVSVSSTLTNPVLTLTASGTNFAECHVSGITSGTFEYCNFPRDCHVYDGTTDIISKADISYPVFGRSKSAFTVNMTGAAMSVTVRKYWRSV